MSEAFERQFAAHCAAADAARGQRVTKSSEFYGTDLAGCDQPAVIAAARALGLAAEFGPGAVGGCYLTLRVSRPAGAAARRSAE